MATNTLFNGDFEQGVFNALTDWDVSFGVPTIVTNNNSPFGGTKAMSVIDSPMIIAHNFGAALTLGDKMYTNLHVELVSGTGSLAIITGGGAQQDARVLVYSDGRIEYRAPAPGDSGTVLRSYSVSDPTTRFILSLPWIVSTTETTSGIGIAQHAAFIFNNVESGFISAASWIIDDVWIATEPQENKVSRPDNGPGPSIFQESHFDEIHGTLHKRKDIQLDYDLRLRTIEDEIRLDHDDYEWNPAVRRFTEP